MAATLRSHWSKAFRAIGIDPSLLHDWLEEDYDHKPFKDTTPFPEDRFRLNKPHINRAIKHSNNSAPGPDGIPFLAWRRACDLSAQILFDAARIHGSRIRGL